MHHAWLKSMHYGRYYVWLKSVHNTTAREASCLTKERTYCGGHVRLKNVHDVAVMLG